MLVDENGGESPAQAYDHVEKSRKIHYVQLAEAEVDEDEQYSLYGVVIDAGYPYKGQNNFLVTLKIADPTLCPTVDGPKGGVKVALVTCYARKLEDLPIVRKIGDVIRIHRVTLKRFNNLKQFNLNINFNSAWCLFHSSDVNLQTDFSDESDQDHEAVMADGTSISDRVTSKQERRKYTPYKFSSSSYSFDFQQEKKIIDSLRTWEDDFFQNRSSWVFKKLSKPLGEIKQDEKFDYDREFDVIVKILKIFEKDDYNLELRIKDFSDELWFIIIPKMKFGPLREGDVIRIRAVNVNPTSKRNLISIKHCTSILRFTSSCKIA